MTERKWTLSDAKEQIGEVIKTNDGKVALYEEDFEHSKPARGISFDEAVTMLRGGSAYCVTWSHGLQMSQGTFWGGRRVRLVKTGSPGAASL